MTTCEHGKTIDIFAADGWCDECQARIDAAGDAASARNARLDGIVGTWLSQMSDDDRRGIQAAGSADAWREGLSMAEGLDTRDLDYVLDRIVVRVTGEDGAGE